MDINRQIEEMKIMVEADQEHLAEAIKQGNRTDAHTCVDSIIDLKRRIEDLQSGM